MPESVTLMTMGEVLKKAASTDDTTTSSFVTRAPTTTEPSGSGVNTMTQSSGGVVQNIAKVMPYGLGADGTTFSMRITGWIKLPSSNPPSVPDLWIPVNLCEISCTCSGTQQSIRGSDISDSYCFCDTLAVVGTSGNPGVSLDIVSPTGGKGAHLSIDVKGFLKIQFDFLNSTTSAANAVFGMY